MAARNNNSEQFHISWMTISYRTLWMLVVALIIVGSIGAYLMFPQSGPVQGSLELGGRVLQKLGLMSAPVKKLAGPGPQQAHFTNLDGGVKVKRASSNTWVSADYSLPLEKGDVVQTSSEGMAKVVFSDGTSYTIKPDSLIVIEENSTNAAQQTAVAVQVTTGTVDLSTATYAQGSKSEVIVAGATASLAPESAAMVHNDPRKDQHEILVKKGSGRVTRNSEVVELANFERVSFKADSAQMERTREVVPPTLIEPANMMPVYTSAGSAKAVDFSWTPVNESHGYHLRVSRNPYFSSTVYDRIVPDPEAKVAGLKEGTYYWLVLSLDAKGRESVESERNQFTIVAKSGDQGSVTLDLQELVQHGHVIEVAGKTEPAARVMVNGQEVPLILPDGSFHYFTPPLARGENLITVTAQNARGGVKTQQKKVVIE
jgi:hypothetical protein